jgi:PncC family amidohydrolase
VRRAATIGALLEARNATLAVAESCTGGMLGAAITAVSGSSQYFLGGVIAYDNAVKESMLRVAHCVLRDEGAVSDSVARLMAEGVRKRLKSDYGIATTGIAGPGGGTRNKPVGLVFVAVAGPDGTASKRCRLSGGRAAVRRAACSAALGILERRLRNKE